MSFDKYTIVQVIKVCVGLWELEDGMQVCSWIGCLKWFKV
jgi:hypothetical protein